ncbi:hypothetical protein CBS101457_003409 [Exobasidium rhododendri]|nr:hypothetical protein CBS101457_003409 [Exobasidium rhododendri]
MPSLADLEKWMEEQIPPNLHKLPMKVTTTIQSYSSHLYSQLADMTPTYSQIESSIESSLQSIPFVGSSISQALPSVPPPPPPPTSLTEALLRRGDDFTGSRTKTSLIGGVAIVGITCAVWSQSPWPSKRSVRSPKMHNGARQEAIVVLGGDTALGQALCHHLSTQGFIVLASVANEQSMQHFDSLLQPSARGYVKSIILSSSDPRAEEVDYFVRSVASARELRWPLTSAGDPYSSPGTELEVAGVVNALSYKCKADISNRSTSMHVDRIANDLHQRVVTPLATIKALFPLIVGGSSSSSSSPPSFVVSLVSSDAEMSDQALSAGMKSLQKEVLEEETKQRSRSLPSAGSMTKRRVLLTTVEVRSSTLSSLLLSALPSSIGGAAPQTKGRRRGTSLSVSSGSGRVSIDTRGNPVEKPARPRNAKGSRPPSKARTQREQEYEAILEAVTGILLLPCSTKNVRSRYHVRLPAPTFNRSSSDRRTSETHGRSGLEKTTALQLLSYSSVPMVLLGNLLSRIRFDPRYWWASCTPSTFTYSGSRNSANSRPAFGPGPGPASNTHSRSCIREQQQQQQQRPNHQSSDSARRPASVHSNSSSEATRSTESSGQGASTSGPGSAASGPPSHNGLSSSGLLSSVPSSAFGDASDHEQYDFDGSIDSPVQGSGVWASPIPSDTDSDTALGIRTDDNQAETDQLENTTPHASQFVDGSEVQYGFPSQASMQSDNGDEAWMGPSTSHAAIDSLSSSTSSPTTAPTTTSQLGQSWVELSKSQTREAPK